VQASASWDLDLWGKNRQRLDQAVSQEKATEAGLQQARVTLAASVASTYNQLARLYVLRDIAVHEIRNREDILRITSGRVASGLDTEVERETASGNLATSHSTVSDLDGQITTVRHELGALLGHGPDRGLQIAQPVLTPGAAVALPDNLPADLVSRRPDIVAARWQVEADAHDVREAKAEFFPDINLAAVSVSTHSAGDGCSLQRVVKSRLGRPFTCRASMPVHCAPSSRAATPGSTSMWRTTTRR
jgi:NodT family efflux transporter outer membrane factor (OMF) lipoprotein